MQELGETVVGGYTRNCPNCGHMWAVENHGFGREKQDPCPECEYVAEPGETVFDGSICPACGKEMSANPEKRPVNGFPGQGYCSVEHAGII